MRKAELLKLKPQYATPSMMLSAANDIPIRKTFGWSKTYYDDYNSFYYMRGKIDGGIIRIAIFFTENMRLGNKKPVFEIFIDKEKRDFITYDYKHNKWSNAKIDMLSWPHYRFSEKEHSCKNFNKFIKKHLETKRGGYDGILAWQQGVRAEQLDARHKKETAPWDLAMSKVSPTPADWKKWVDKCGITENFIFYDYTPKGATKGYCSWCDKIVNIKKPRHNGVGKCTCCGHDIQYKAIGKAGTFCTNITVVYLLQKYEDKFIIRQFRAFRKYRKEKYTKPEVYVSEFRRVIFDSKFNGEAYYYGLYKQAESRWIYDGVPTFYEGYFISYYDGCVYKRTLPSLIKFLDRTGLPEMIRQLPAIDPERYLLVLKNKKYFEQLAKAGLTKLVFDIMHNSGYHSNFDFEQSSSLAKSLQIDKSRMKRLRKCNGGMLFLEWLKFEKNSEKNIDDAVISWFTKEKIRPDELKFISDRMSELQIKNYLIRQQQDMRLPIKEIMSTWDDYLKMAARAKMNVHDAIVFRAKKLKQRHDELVKLLGSKNLAIRAGEIATKFPDVDLVCDEIRSKYEFEDEKYIILVPKNIEDILNEGQTLHHCIDRTDRYFERIQTRESFLLFLRKKEDASKPWYTLEVEPCGTIRQKRTEYDRQNTDLKDTEEFLKAWQKSIQKNITEDDIRMAEESKNLRIKEFEEMRKNNVKISHGHLAGHLLADVLETDLMESEITARRAV